MSRRQDLWREKLTDFKQREKPEVVLMVAGSAELTRIVLAWSGMPTKHKRRSKPCCAESEEETWLWLWDSVEFSQGELVSRVPGSTARTASNFAALVANRVLYPDGTVNSFVSRYMKERVLSLFKIQRTAPARDVSPCP